MSIDGVDEGTASELQARARDVLEERARRAIEAAREMGVDDSLFGFEGLTPEMILALAEDDVKSLLGLPDGAKTMGLIPLGYPAQGRWAQPKRRPVDEVTHWGAWGEQRARPEA
mgnify:CR=1 FL=1